MINDKRRYLSRNPSSRRDEIIKPGADETGNAAKDGYTVRYRTPMMGRPNPHPVPDESPRYGREGRKDSSRYSENYACEGLMTDEEARMERLYGYTIPD